MAKKWIMVRITPETHARLDAVRNTLLKADESGQIILDRDDRGRVSLDQTITVLLSRHEGHKRRVRKSQAKRVSKRLADFAAHMGGEPL